MKRYELQIRNAVKKDIDQIKDFIVGKSNRKKAEQYATELYNEMYSLTFLADSIKITEWKTAKKYSRSKKEKKITTHNKKWCIFFHTYRKYVIVDKILAAKLVKE